jgi:heme oxygenase
MTGFAARLRRATMTEHREAETRGFISRLLAGQVPIAGFTPAHRPVPGHLPRTRGGEKYGLGRAATSFYRFDQIPDPRTYKIAYRHRLDALALPEPQLAALASEARLAFTLNAAILTELGDKFPPDLAQAA